MIQNYFKKLKKIKIIFLMKNKHTEYHNENWPTLWVMFLYNIL